MNSSVPFSWFTGHQMMETGVRVRRPCHTRRASSPRERPGGARETECRGRPAIGAAVDAVRGSSGAPGNTRWAIFKALFGSPRDALASVGAGRESFKVACEKSVTARGKVGEAFVQVCPWAGKHYVALSSGDPRGSGLLSWGDGGPHSPHGAVIVGPPGIRVG